MEVDEIYPSNYYGDVVILECCGYNKNRKLCYKIKFLNSNNIGIFDKYSIENGSIEDIEFIYNKIIGEIRNSNSFGPFKIIELVSKTRRVYYKIKFLNTGFETIVRKDCIDNGRVTDFSITLNKVENINRFNSLYYHLLKRVKDNNLDISDEWRNNKKSFEKWYKENKYAEFLEVDKDILSIIKNDGILKYSKDTCLLLPPELNSEIVNLTNIPTIKLKYNLFEIVIDCFNLKIENLHIKENNIEDLINKYIDVKFKSFLFTLEKYKYILPNKLYLYLKNLDLEAFKNYIIKYKIIFK